MQAKDNGDRFDLAHIADDLLRVQAALAQVTKRVILLVREASEREAFDADDTYPPDSPDLRNYMSETCEATFPEDWIH